MTAPEVAQIRARREERFALVAADPAFWAWVAADARRLLAEHPDVYGRAGAAGTLASLAMVSDWVAQWRRYPHEVVRVKRSAPEEHGTEKGYQQHRSRCTPYCASCRRAHADWDRTRKQNMKRAQGAAS